MQHTDRLVFEVHDNFQKQTYRNRCYIYGANGKQLLNIPIHKVTGKQLYRDIKIDYSSNWQAEHLKTLYSAYNSSPFFEFYIDDLKEIFHTKEMFLIDLNIKTFQKMNELLQESVLFEKTKLFSKEFVNDFRFLVNAKNKEEITLPKYTQVFSEKHGFMHNLSMLDLLFMEGPASSIYLKKVIANYPKNY